MMWHRMFIVLFLWSFTIFGAESFRNKEAERRSTKKQTKNLFKSFRNHKPSDTVVDSANIVKQYGSVSQLTQFVKPQQFENDNRDEENQSDYDDKTYNERDYPQDDTMLNSFLPSKSKEIEKQSVSDSSFVDIFGESEIARRTTNMISGEGGKLMVDKQTESLNGLEDDKRKQEESQPKEQQEKLLLQKLMEGYERDVRPVRNASHPVVIHVGITLTQIFDMDEKQQVLTTNVWLDQEWNDEMLRWNPEDFGGLKTIRLPCERIWLPDIVLYNNADDYTRGYMPSRAMVSYDGNVFWPPPTKFRSTCSVDVTYFPFDDQVCFLKLGSWTYNGFQVDVTNRTSAVDLSNYISNGEWELVKAIQKRNVVFYSCCPEPFPDVTITLVIQRKTLYYIYNIVLPCIMLSALTLLVFCLPPDSGEKIALGITVLLAFSVFMLAINESLPETSESIPLIGVYLTIVMAITSVSVIMTVVVLNLHYLGPKVRPIPKWLMCLLPKENRSQIRQRSLLIPMTQREPKSGSLKRSHVVITTKRGTGEESYSVEVPGEILEDTRVKDASDGSSESNTNENSGNYFNNTRRKNCSSVPNTLQSTSSQCYRQDGQLRQPLQSQNSFTNNVEQNGIGTEIVTELLSSIRLLIKKQEDIETQNNLVAEWRLVAQVVDRILFWIFFTFTFTSSAIILLILPIYKRNWYGIPMFDDNETESVAF